MSLLICGEWHSSIHEEQLYTALRTFRSDVISYKTYPFFKISANNAFLNRLLRFSDKYSIGLPVLALNLHLSLFLIINKPSHVLLYRPRHLYPLTFLFARLFCQFLLITYNNDCPFSSFYPAYFWRRFFAILPLSDFLLAYRPSDLKHYIALNPNSYMFPPWYSSIASSIQLRPFSQRSSRILFVGHAEDDFRIPILTSIASNLDLYGPRFYWEYPYISKELKSIAREPIWGQDYYRLLSSHKIALCFLSSLNADVYTRRCFEIPSVGTLLFTQYSEYLEEFYEGDGVGCVLFSTIEEFSDKYLWLTTHPDSVDAIAERGASIVKKRAFSDLDRALFIDRLTRSTIEHHDIS